MPLRPDHSVALLTCLLVASCAAVAPKPPAELLAPCAEPAATRGTNGTLAQYALNLRSALRACNDDKAALRMWASELEK